MWILTTSPAKIFTLDHEDKTGCTKLRDLVNNGISVSIYI